MMTLKLTQRMGAEPILGLHFLTTASIVFEIAKAEVDAKGLLSLVLVLTLPFSAKKSTIQQGRREEKSGCLLGQQRTSETRYNTTSNHR